MKLLIIRHGDPDYENDTLTPQGMKEAKCLAARLLKMKIDKVYVSSLGRAKRTARYYLDAAGRSTDGILDWLQEFRGRCIRPDLGYSHICWDWLPQDWMGFAPFYDKDHWFEHPVFKDTNVKEEYDRVVCELDRLLAENGYVRNLPGAATGEVCGIPGTDTGEACATTGAGTGEENDAGPDKRRRKTAKGTAVTPAYYRVEKPNNDTIALFCHFGLESVILSHLLGISPMVLWHATAAAPTSVTTVATEERREGIASWRILSYGDVSHLYAFGVEPSFSARFCECWKNEDERHD